MDFLGLRPREHRRSAVMTPSCKNGSTDDRSNRPSQKAVGSVAKEYLMRVDADPFRAKPACQIAADAGSTH